jgi:hypothetical protein
MTPRPLIVQWPGVSGRWYAHTVFPWDLLPDVENANFILVAGQGKDAGLPLFIGSSEALTRELPLRPEWSAAQMQGLTHVHVHLLAADAREREGIRLDIAGCVETPLNWDIRPQAGREGMAGLVRVTPGGPVRWLGGRQPSHRATQLGLEFILPQAHAVRRAG